MKTLKLIALSIFTINLVAQSPDIIINEADPLWVYTIVDEDFGQNGVPFDSTTAYDKYSSCFPSSINYNNGNIILYTPCINDNNHEFGGILHAVNSKSGNLNWNNGFTKWTGETVQQRYVHPIIRSKANEIILTGQINPLGEESFPPWIGGMAATPVKRIFSLDKGNLLSYDYNQNDNNGIFNVGDLNNFHKNSSTGHIYYQNITGLSIDDYTFHLDFIDMKSNFVFDTLNSIGKISLPFKPFKWFGDGWNQSFTLNDSTYIFTRPFMFNEYNGVENQALLHYLIIGDDGVKLKKRVDLTDYHIKYYQDNSLSNYGFNDDGELFIEAKYYDTLNTDIVRTWFLWLDENGEEKVYLPNLTKENGDLYIIHLFLHKTEDEIFLLQLDRGTNNTSGEIIGIRSDGSVNYYSTFTSPSNDWRISPARPGRDNGKFYMSIYYEGTNNLVAFDLRDFGVDLPSDTHDETTSPNITIAPIPTNGQLTLSSERNLAKYSLELFNNVGQKIKTLDASNGNEINIDLAQYASGVYYIKMRDKDTGYTISKKVLLVR